MIFDGDSSRAAELKENRIFEMANCTEGHEIADGEESCQYGHVVQGGNDGEPDMRGMMRLMLLQRQTMQTQLQPQMHLIEQSHKREEELKGRARI